MLENRQGVLPSNELRKVVVVFEVIDNASSDKEAVLGEKKRINGHCVNSHEQQSHSICSNSEYARISYQESASISKVIDFRELQKDSEVDEVVRLQAISFSSHSAESVLEET